MFSTLLQFLILLTKTVFVYKGLFDIVIEQLISCYCRRAGTGAVAVWPQCGATLTDYTAVMVKRCDVVQPRKQCTVNVHFGEIK